MESVIITLCPDCGVELQIGDYPFCPHGRYQGAAQTDSIPGGLWLENGFKEPVKVYSYSEMHQKHAEAGVTIKEKFCPMPGTDIDPAGIPNPAGYKDPYTLAAGAALIMRNGGAREKEWDGVEAGVLRDVQVGHITERDAKAIAEGDRQRQSRFHRRTS